MKSIAWVGAAALAVMCLASWGCPKRVKEATQALRTAQDVQDGDFTVKNEEGEEVHVKTEGDEDSRKVTLTTPEGQTTTTEFGKNAVTEEDVGVAFYPGATVDESASSVTQGEEAQTWNQVILITKDPFDKVASFYKDKYGKGNTVMDTPGNCMIMIDEGQNKGKMITVSEDKEEGVTRILIARGGA